MADEDLSAVRRSTLVSFLLMAACGAGLVVLYLKYRVGPPPTKGAIVEAPNLYRRLGAVTIAGIAVCLLGLPMGFFGFVFGLMRLRGKR